nr:hypothetical protein [Kutzneria sp. CA-103260]
MSDKWVENISPGEAERHQAQAALFVKLQERRKEKYGARPHMLSPIVRTASSAAASTQLHRVGPDMARLITVASAAAASPDPIDGTNPESVARLVKAHDPNCTP